MTKPTIVVLDGHTIIQRELSWDGFSAYGNLTVYERTSPDEMIERCKDAEIILTNKAPIGEKEMAALPKLRYISVMATGYNIVDTKAAASNNIVVTNIPAYSTDSVAQLVFAFILHFASRVDAHARSVKQGDWQRALDFSYSVDHIMELNGKSLGIVGYGKIGQRVVRIAHGFGLSVLVNSRSQGHELLPGSRFVDLDELLKQSDFISLHTTLTSQTYHLINTKSLAQVKPSAILINTGRGGLIDEPALADALNQDKIAGAGLDVLAEEPPVKGSPLIAAKNCVITPHIGWATLEARQRLLQILIENLDCYLKGQIKNRVN